VYYDNSLVVTITVACHLRAPSSSDHLFTCGAIYRPPRCLCLLRDCSLVLLSPFPLA